MVEKYLISQDDVMKFQPMDTIPQGRFDPYILKAQELDLKPVLNEVLYYDFLTKFDVLADAMYDEYQSLLNGTTYTYAGQTIEFPGIKPMLCAFTLARFVPMNQINISRYGVVIKTTGQSEPAPATSLTYMANNLKADAIAYQNQVEKYLQQNPTTYPLYNVAPESVQSRSGVKFINSASRSSGYHGWWNGNYYP